MRIAAPVIILTFVLFSGCIKENPPIIIKYLEQPRPEIKDPLGAYPELPPVDVPGLEGLADSLPINYDLSEVSYLPSNWGTPAQRRLLSEHGFVVTDKTCRQICSFYIEPDRPAFITTDSLLYAYYVNVEEGLYRLEVKQADGLRELLKKIRGRLRSERLKYARVRGAGKLDEPARELDAYLSVAETLTRVSDKGAIPRRTPADQRKEIELILAAEGPAVSPLRGVPVDYSRFKPRGLYAKKRVLAEEMEYVFEPDELKRRQEEIENRPLKLGNYYRAVTWLREVPFRVSDENETLQALLLVALDVALGPEESPLAAFNAPYVEFLGPSDDPGIKEYREVYLDYAVSLDRLARDEECRKKAFGALRELPPPRCTTIPDAAAVKDPGRYGGLRFIPRPALYENEIFGALGPYGLGRIPPSGEELFAVMGNRAAQEIVKGREARRVPGYDKLFAAAVAAAEKAEKTYNTEVCRKRRALYRYLLETPEDAKLPLYYRHSAWRYKDLNTCLAGWAHHRYVWDLHGKKNALYVGEVDHQPDNAVEPNVGFFRALRELSRATGRYFGRYGISDHRFEEIADIAEVLTAVASRQIAGEPLNGDQKDFLTGYGELLGSLCGFLDISWLVDENLPDTPFCVPTCVDLYTGNERVVGQGRPRAIYVICEQEGQKFLARGGVLSYRDWLGPAWGEGKMTEKRWLELAAEGKLKAPAWQEEFSAPADLPE